MTVKIFTMTHKAFEAPKDDMYIPLHVGRATAQELGYLSDATGDNISTKNCYYSELTGIYWVWKNYHDADNVGICHYRRYLLNENEQILNEAECITLLKEYDLITTKKLLLNVSYYEGYAANHHIKDLEATGKIIKEKYAEYYETYDRIVHSKYTYFGNIMITSKALFDEYASWLFGIFFEVQKEIDIDSYDDYHKRVFGFISEILLLVWVTVKKLKVYECKVGMFGEKKETVEMKNELANFFAKKDIEGAKNYFTKYLEKRPDVLMEASDVNGELKLAMQVIASADAEYKAHRRSILDEKTDFKELVDCFKRLNEVTKSYESNPVAYHHFIRDNKISDEAAQISKMIQ